MKMLEEQKEPKFAQKRTKFQEITEEGGEDGISELPDCLLLEILSRLPSTKYAIRTGTLSKRWAHLWTWSHTLTFSYSDLPLSRSIENPESYTLLMDKTLTQCRQTKLKKLEVHAYYDIRFESQFKNWIRHAISCNVENLNLEIWYTGREGLFRLDQNFIFTNSYFIDLRLVGCILNPTGAISWKNLRSLCISHLNLDEDVIVNILSGSPLLETLVLVYCYGYNMYDITDETEHETEYKSLTQCPQLKLKKFKIITCFHIQYESQLNSWIRYAIRCNVKEFIIMFGNTGSVDGFMLDQTVFTSSCFTELSLYGCMVNPVGAISWKNLRSLSISCGNLDEDLINNILSGSPVLESLVLDGCYGYKRLDITSKSVKNLVLFNYRNPRDKFKTDIIEINAPNILSLAIQFNILLGKLLLLNVSSLVKANLNYTCTTLKFKEGEEELLKGFIMNLGHVKEIKIGPLCSEYVSCLQAQGFIFPSNVKFHGVCFENGYQGGDHGPKG